MLFCKPNPVFPNYVNLCSFLAYPPVNPVFTGDFFFLPVEKSVDNVENFPLCKPEKYLFFKNYVNGFSVPFFLGKISKILWTSRAIYDRM